MQLAYGVVGVGIVVNALHDETGGTVQHAAVATVLPHPRQDFERGGKRILQAVGDEHDVVGQAVNVRLDHLFHTAAAHEHHRSAVGQGLVQFLGENVLYLIFLADGVEQLVMVGENRLPGSQRRCECNQIQFHHDEWIMGYDNGAKLGKICESHKEKRPETVSRPLFIMK